MRSAVRSVVVFAILGLAACDADDARPTASAASSDGELVQCEDVPRDLCLEYASGAMTGPQPSGAGAIQRVVVTCDLRPPCERDRSGSGGKIRILYSDGSSWTQDWEVDAGL